MADEVTTCNSALAIIGISPISSLSDDSKPAEYCNRFYASTRDEVVQSHRWNFAMKRASLTKLATAAPPGWSAVYTLPSDWLQVVQVNGYEPNEPQGEFAVEAGKLLTNTDTAEVRYVARVTDASAFPPIFLEALATRLASKLAGPLIGSNTIAQELLKTYEGIVGAKARMADVFEDRARRKPAWVLSDLVAARVTG